MTASDSSLLSTTVSTVSGGRVTSVTSSNGSGTKLYDKTYTYSTDGKTVTIVTDYTSSSSNSDKTEVRTISDASATKSITVSTYSGLTATGTPTSETTYTYVMTSATNYDGWTPDKEADHMDLSGVEALQTYENRFFLSGAPGLTVFYN